MNKQEFSDSLEFLFNGQTTIGLSMYLVLNTDGEVLIKKADLDESVIQELRSKFLSRLRMQTNSDDTYTLADISHADNRKYTIYHYDLAEMPSGLDILKAVTENEHRDMFDFSNDDFKSITGFIFLLGSADENIAIYKKMYPISLIKRDSVLMVFRADTRLTKLDEDILKINDDFDFILIDNDLYVLNINTLEKYFGFEDIIRRQSDNNLQLIETSGLLDSVAPLKEMAKELRYARKIVRLNKESPVLKLPFDEIKSFVKNHPKLKNKLKFNSDESRLSLDTNVSKELFLKLLDDDFLKSELTNLLYESEVKDRLTQEED